MSWIAQPIYFVDFEGSHRAGILEFGVVRVLGGTVAAERTRLCRPTAAVSPPELAAHGLAPPALAAAAPFADEWEYFAALRAQGPLAAHYSGVENALLKSVWPYCRLAPDFAREGAPSVEWGPWVDTARLYAQLYPGLASGELRALVRAAGLQPELDRLAAAACPPDRRHYHAALYDALAGALLLAALAAEPRLADLSLCQLLALSTCDGSRRDELRQGRLF